MLVQVGQAETLFAGLDSGRAGNLDHLPTGDRGQDAPVGGGREEPALADHENARPRCLEHRPVRIEQQRQLARRCGRGPVKQPPVDPLVFAEATGNNRAAQGGPAIGSGEHGVDIDLLRLDLDSQITLCLGRLFGLSAGRFVPRWHDRKAQFPVLDSRGACEHQAPRPSGQGAAVERLDARAEPPEVGIELERSPGDDEHGLEDAPAGIGMGEC
jgi:hypothetical protein